MFVERTAPELRGTRNSTHGTQSARSGRMYVLDQIWDAEAAEMPIGGQGS